MTKKVISILLVICMLASPVSLVNVANAEEKSQNEEVKYSKELASHCEIAQLEKFIKYIYQCKDMGEPFSRNLYQNSNLKMSDEVFEYLNDKINIQQEATKKNLTQKEKYKVTVFLQNVEQCEDYVIGCDFQVISKYHYVGVSEPTTVSELVQIKYDELSNEILEFYTPLNYYDEEVRETNNFTIN